MKIMSHKYLRVQGKKASVSDEKGEIDLSDPDYFIRLEHISFFQLMKKSRTGGIDIVLISLINGKIVEAEDPDGRIYNQLLRYAGFAEFNEIQITVNRSENEEKV